MKRELVQVRWVDSCSPRGWTSKDALKDYRPDTVTSVGWIIEEGDNFLTIAGHEGRDCVDGVLSIPKSAVLGRKALRH